MNESDLNGKVRAGRGVFSIFLWINVLVRKYYRLDDLELIKLLY